MVSIIIPAYNEEKYIARCLDSVCHQSDDVIVVINGSTDNTFNIAKMYPVKIKVLHEANVSKARNHGASLAKYDSLLFLDADTVLSDCFVSRIDTKLGSARSVPIQKNIIFKTWCYTKYLCHKYNIYHGQSGCLIVDKKIFNKVKGYNENLKVREDKTLINHCEKYVPYKVHNETLQLDMRRYEGKILRGAWLWIKIFLTGKRDKYPPVR